MELIIGEIYYHKMMAQQFQLLAIHEDCAWLVTIDDKVKRLYMSTQVLNLEKEKAPLPQPSQEHKYGSLF